MELVSAVILFVILWLVSEWSSAKGRATDAEEELKELREKRRKEKR